MDAAQRVLHDELRFIRDAVTSGNRAQVLKSLDERGTAEELVQREYGGRFIFELLQNANDAAGGESGTRRGQHRVSIVVTEESLLFANEGQGFQVENVKSICTLGNSSKDPRKALGYKGLGFKSVGEVTDQPQVISPPYEFEFSRERARREVGRLVESLPFGQRLPVYAFPFPLRRSSLGNDQERVSALLGDGFVTVIRLPFDAGTDWNVVLSEVRSVITPELLLFLDNTTEVEISWPSGRSRVVKRDVATLGSGAVVEVGRDGQSYQKWLVFRSGPIELPNARLVESLDRTWHRVRRVSASLAFPLDGDQLAVDQSERRIAVYFPTMSSTGHAFLVNGDFYLDLNRRHISDTPQALPYNTWLAQRVGVFFGKTVLPSLAAMYPRSYRVVNACAPVGTPTGFGAVIAQRLRDEMERARFVPTSGDPVTPGKALRSPVPRDAATAFHRFFGGPALGAAQHALVHVDVENDTRADGLIQSLGAKSVADDVVLRALRRPLDFAEDVLPEFYSLLSRWLSNPGGVRRQAGLRDELRRQAIFRTVDGRWVSGTVPVFFSRARGSTEVPEGFPGNILHADSTGGRQDVSRFLEELGVQPFRWREVILTSLLPVLRRHPTERQIYAAHRFLRTYLAEERSGDQAVADAIGVVPVRVRVHGRRKWEWRRADRTYFGREWLESPDLEDLYGPLGQAEFLAEPVPFDEDSRAADREYFAWLGVSDRPRLVSVDNRIQLGAMVRHPEGTQPSGWRAYIQSLDRQVHDPQGHPQSQILRTSTLDRLDALLSSPTPKQGRALLRMLAAHWQSYEGSLVGGIYCANAQHRGERSRLIESYSLFRLRARPWVPVQIGGVGRMLTPGEVWITGADVPRRLGQLLPRIAIENYPGTVILVAHELGFVEPSDASADDYAKLLRLIPDEFPLPVPPAVKTPRKRRVYEEQTANLARWVMSGLNTALGEDLAVPDDRLMEWRKIPLLATRDGLLTFSASPVVADDSRLAKRLGGRFAWFQGDKGWNRLIEAFALRRLTAIASVEAIPGDPLHDPTRDLTRKLKDASPYILALLEAEAASELAQARGRLDRFEVSVVEHLTLRVTVREAVPDELHVSEESYLKQRVRAGTGRIQFASAMYYCTASAANDEYGLGSAVADFIQRPTLGVAISIVLRSGRGERMRLLAAKDIDPSRVRAMRELLGRPEDEEDPDEPIVPVPRKPGQGNSSSRGTGNGSVPGPGNHANDRGTSNRNGHEDNPRPQPQPAPPPLDAARLGVVDAYDGDLRPHGSPNREHVSGNGTDRASRHPNWEAMESNRRLYGRRGEEAAFEAERNRLRQAGLDPDLVRWISRDDEQADHDLESVGDDGATIYIEVKSTVSADPGEPFPITSTELRFAARHRTRYFIYRVTCVQEPAPSVTRYRDPIGLWEAGKMDTEVTQARMWLPQQSQCTAVTDPTVEASRASVT